MKTSFKKNLWNVSLCFSCAFALILSVGLVASFLVNHSSLRLLLLFIQGWLIWTFLEYFIHRFLMHELIVPGSKDTLFNHHNHHKDPGMMKINHRDRLMGLGLFLITLLIAIFRNEFWIIPSGFIFGFTFYTYLHLLLHLPIGKILLPRIQRAHILHHSIRPNKGYSFSTILWDWMFGTLPSKNDQVTEMMMKKYFSDFDHRGHLSSWTLPIPPVAIGLILLTASCAPVFSDLQSARTLGKGELEATPYYTTTGNDSEFDGVTHLGGNFGYGINGRFDIRGRIESNWFNGEDNSNVTVVGIGPKLSILPNQVSLYLPVGRALQKEISDSWQMQPTLFYTIPLVSEKVEFTISPKYLIPLCRDCGGNFATNFGFSFGKNLSNNAFRIEYGRIFDSDGGIGQLSLGYSINLKPINR